MVLEKSSTNARAYLKLHLARGSIGPHKSTCTMCL